KNETFQEFVQLVADNALASGLNGGKNGEDVEALLEMNGLKEVLIEKTATIGEKLSIRRFAKVTGECVASYLHAGGKIGVLVAADGAADAKEALTNVAMQVAAMNPQYISRDDIAQAEIDKMREIIVDSSLNDPASLPKPILNALIDKACTDKVWSDEDIAIYEEKKSNMNYLFNFLSKEAKAALVGLAMEDKANIVENKIFSGAVEGRVSKQLKEICLLDQTYVRAEDGKQTVGAYLKSVNGALVIKNVVRFEVGEGIEKKVDDFAAEVAAQMAGN
ncbi:MAG: translation elongation factor Ts, partial [Roseburia sp.]|nr:translation elongation factor Ts [Roseburia sp.]